jgi:hypothetical protein
MSFNSSAFVIAGTAIAIFGVGLYIWDTRKDKVVNTYNQYRQGQTQAPAPASVQTYNPVQTTPTQVVGGSKKYRRLHKNTKKYKKSIKRKNL